MAWKNKVDNLDRFIFPTAIFLRLTKAGNPLVHFCGRLGLSSTQQPQSISQIDLLFFAVYVIYKKNYSFSTVYSGVKFFLSDQNCQLFLFKNKWEQYG